MPYELKDLMVNRVDLVDEGANSAAFIELYKRKETQTPMDYEEILSKMKPEHVDVIRGVVEAKDAELSKAREDLEVATQSLADTESKLNAANDELAKANTELETLKAKDGNCECDGEADEDGKCKSCGKPKKSAALDETETLKSMPEAARALFEKMRAQKEAAEEQIRKANAERVEAEAIAKAASLKAIPVEQSKLVDILKSCSPEVADLLTSINSAIEATVLDEVGKNKGNGASTGHNTSDEAWEKLEKKAEEIAKRDGVTVEKAMSTALSENPELYHEYLTGGAK
jgi:multidrug efflux pump subunit AcrA (membrane-fusion protein)